jgi:prephenate dehydrogenase
MDENRGFPEGLRTVAVVGLGLLGGSLGLALRRQAPALRVLGLARRKETLERALETGVVDAGSSEPAEILPQADLTVICLPVNATIEFGCRQAQLWRPGTLVTDVGSIKGDIVEEIRPVLQARGVHFIGSHPMAGAETSGLESAQPNMYDGAIVFLTRVAGDSPTAWAALNRFWEALGSRPVEMELARHDALVARTSHVLHLFSAAAAEMVLAQEQAVLGTAGGFRDMSRIAASSPDMWRDIFQHNRGNVLAAMDEVMAEMRDLREMLVASEWDGIMEYLGRAKARRDSWFQSWQAQRGKTC